MNGTMKGFIYGIATVAVALFFGFGGGVLIANWLNEDPLPKQSRLEKVRETDGRSMPEIGATTEGQERDEAKKEGPKRDTAKEPAPDENPLQPKKVVTQTVNSPLSEHSQSNALPLTSTPLGPPQPLVRVEPQPTPRPAPRIPPSSQFREVVRELAPTTGNQQDGVPRGASRSRAIEQHVVGPDFKRREARETKPGRKHHQSRRSPAETSASAPRDDMAFEDGERTTRATRSETRRNVRGRTIDDDDHNVVEQRPVAPLRPLFGLFGQ